MSINWHQRSRCQSVKASARDRKNNAMTEITIGATGLKRGKKPKAPGDVPGCASRLCRLEFLRRCKRCTAIRADAAGEAGGDIDGPHGSGSAGKVGGYMQYKRISGRMVGDDSFMGPLKGWIRSGHDDDFIHG